MQATPELACPSASMGVEWVGSESDMLYVTVKRVAKESIFVWVWMRCETRDSRNGLTKCLRIRGSLKLSF